VKAQKEAHATSRIRLRRRDVRCPAERRRVGRTWGVGRKL
jgi:hypothetical protein